MHDCKLECKHDSVKFCKHCNKVYCENCKREWENPCTKAHYDVWYTPTTPVYPNYKIWYWYGNDTNTSIEATTIHEH